MGYFVGRSSTPSSMAPVSAGAASTGGEAPASGAPLPPGHAEVVPAEKKSDDATAAAVRPVANVAPPAASAVPAAEPSPVRAEAKPAPPKAEPRKEIASAPAAEAKSRNSGEAEGLVTRPAKGQMYLQVSAPLPAAAKGVVEALRRQGIQAIVAPGPPNKDTVRVLVGPFEDSAGAGKMRVRLAEIGFKDTFVQKY